MILICTACERAVLPTLVSALKHYKKEHCDTGETVEGLFPGLTDRLKLALEGHSFADPKVVRFQLPNQAPISGIKVHNGFSCPMKSELKEEQCWYVGGESGTIDTHIKNEHRGQNGRPAAKDLKDHTCSYQTLFNADLRHYFQVRTGLADADSHMSGSLNAYSAFVRQMGSMPSPAPPPEPVRDNELPSLLRATSWNVFLEPYRTKPKDVVALIRYPTPGLVGVPEVDVEVERVLRELPDLATTWMKKVHVAHTRVSKYALRALIKYPM